MKEPLHGLSSEIAPERRLRVLVIDAEPGQRARLSTQLAADARLEVVGQVAPLAAAVRAVSRLHPDVIAIGLQLSPKDGLETIRQLMRDAPTPIVAVAPASHGGHAPLESAALEAGALALVDATSGEALGMPSLAQTVK